MRATYEHENGDIIITSLPYQVSPTRVIEQVALQMREKKLPMVSDIRDLSDQDEPTRLMIMPAVKPGGPGSLDQPFVCNHRP